MAHLIANVVIALIGPVVLALTVATVVAIPVGCMRFDLQARAFVPRTMPVLLRIYAVATGLGVFSGIALVIGGVGAILAR